MWPRLILLVPIFAGLIHFRPERAFHVAAGITAHTLCSAVFVSGLDPRTTFDETVRPMVSVAGPLLRFSVDRAEKTVNASVLGAFASTAAFHPGYGCRLEYADSISVPPLLPETQPVAEAATFETADADLRAALDRAFAEESGHVPRHVKAVVIVREGRIVAERYAAGYGVDTPLPSFSVAKSVTNALIGILVRQGRLKVDAAAPIAAWRAANDPRSSITIDNLIRMDSGLALAETGTGFDPVSQMLYLQRDMAAFAEAGQLGVRPGTQWDYTSADTLVLADIIRRAIGGGQAEYLRFARAELFTPAGLRKVTMEFDGAGTQVGSTGMLASARDWARFGMLFLNDGVAPDGARILPDGWVAYSKRSTLGSIYGAGFWTSDGPSDAAAALIRAGLPPDTFFASGHLGQRIYVSPAEHLVMIRFGVTHRPPDFDIAGDVRLMRDAIAALKKGTANAGSGVPL